jgi:hypothetical protein
MLAREEGVMAFVRKQRTPEQVAAFDATCVWTPGTSPAVKGTLPLDYPEPEDAMYTCFHCGKRTRQGPEIMPNFFSPPSVFAAPSHCARMVCVDAVTEIALKKAQG